MQWLGKVPPEALIEMRQQGAAEEIRDMLSRGVADIAKAESTNFSTTSDKVVANIQEAFREHQKQIEVLCKKKWRFAGKDVTSWLVVGTLEVAATAIGTPLFGLSAFAAHQLTDIPKLKDLPKSVKELREESQKIRQSPMGLLFKYKN